MNALMHAFRQEELEHLYDIDYHIDAKGRASRFFSHYRAFVVRLEDCHDYYVDIYDLNFYDNLTRDYRIEEIVGEGRSIPGDWLSPKPADKKAKKFFSKYESNFQTSSWQMDKAFINNFEAFIQREESARRKQTSQKNVALLACC